MHVPIRPSGVAEQSGKNYRPAGGTTGSGTIGIVETHPFGSQLIQVRGFNYIIPIRTQSIRSMVIGNKRIILGLVIKVCVVTIASLLSAQELNNITIMDILMASLGFIGYI